MADDGDGELRSGSSPERPPSVEQTVGFDAPDRDPEQAHDRAPLRRGATIGRYVLLEQLGAGAMGVVYRAYDPELDRRLALKLLHPGSGSRDATAMQDRLRREAQALARLTHPNVVAVHDVGTHAGRVFVAMEYVAGRTLRQWLQTDPPPSVAEVLDVFVAAGRGLAAAHRAGLVHRDFKPENVLLGEDGTVRVVDFGLARRSEDEPTLDEASASSPPDDPPPAGREGSLELSLTRTGKLLGTPAYMAPEQHLGETATPRSDQFGFCVALWEALYGERPFAGRNLAALALAVTSGQLEEPPSEGPFANRVPAHVHRALLVGLASDPHQRFANLEALAKALTHDPNRRRRRIARIVGFNLLGALAVFSTGVWFANSFADSEPTAVSACEPERELGDSWNPTREAQLRERFAASSAPFAGHTARELDRRLDAYTMQWLAAWAETCEAERTLGPSEALDLQRECLGQRRRELVAFTDALIDAEPAVFEQRAEFAVAAAEGLPTISTCADPSRLRGEQPSSTLVALQTRLGEAQAIGRLGDPKTGLARALEVVGEARELDSPRMLIRALLVVANLEESANEKDAAAEHLDEAYAIAERHGEDWLRAEAAVGLIGLLGFDLQRPGEAAVWQAIADSVLVRIGDPGDLRGRWWYERGTVHMRGSEFAEAEHALGRALTELEAIYGPDAREIESVVQALGSVARERGDYDRAVAYHTRLLDRRLAAYGPDHPDVALAYASLGNDAYFRGAYPEARELYEQTLKIVAACYGEDGPAYASKLNNYAAVLERLGELDEAEAIHRRLLADNVTRYGERDIRVTTSHENLGLVLLSAIRFEEAAEQFGRSLDIRREHHGDDHAATATSKLNLGYARYRLGDHASARALYEQALATWTAKLGPEHPDLGLAHGNLGELELDEGQLDAARRHYTRALELTQAALGDDAADLGYYLTGLGRVALAERDPDEAIELCERALELRDGAWLPPGDRGETQLTLAVALAQRGRSGDRERVDNLAELALTDIRRSGDAKRIAAAEARLAALD